MLSATVQKGIKVPDVERKDYRIHYEVTRSGDGPTLLLVAGLGEQIGSVEFPKEQCEAFAAQSFQVVRMDNRGAGPDDDGPSITRVVTGRLLEMAEWRERSAAVEHLVEKWRWLWGSSYAFDEVSVRTRVEHAFARAYRPEGVVQMLMAAARTHVSVVSTAR
jgi:pimeloyl-ACP methyl ester carboxylesterase